MTGGPGPRAPAPPAGEGPGPSDERDELPRGTGAAGDGARGDGARGDGALGDAGGAQAARGGEVAGSGGVSNRSRIVQLAVVLAAIVAVFLAAGLGNLLLFIAALVAVVVLHELGHFLTAKWSRMKVTEFFIGFGPRLWSVRRGETDYGIKPILAGAYVKIPGMTNIEEVEEADEPRTYRRQPFHRRIIVASAGSAMHYVIAFILAWVAVVSFGVPSSTATAVTITNFTPWPGRAHTAAQLAGLRPGDRILAVDGRSIPTSAALKTAIQRTGGRPAAFLVTRRGRHLTLTVAPQAGHKVKVHGSTTEVLGPAKSGKTTWLVGVTTLESPLFTAEGPVRAVGTAAIEVGHVTSATVTGIVHIFSPGGLSNLYDQVTNPHTAARAAANPAASNRVMSLVGAARVATQAEKKGFYYFLSILIALNIVLALMNMLPMLPLDGGHVAIAVYERIRTRRGRPYYQADATKLLPVAYAFMAFLILFIGSAIFLDIAHPVANPFG